MTKNNEESREEATAALKQLGDSMKEYHRRRQDIKEAQTNGEEDENLEKIMSVPMNLNMLRVQILKQIRKL